jgi:hypothetical protein
MVLIVWPKDIVPLLIYETVSVVVVMVPIKIGAGALME